MLFALFLVTITTTRTLHQHPVAVSFLIVASLAFEDGMHLAAHDVGSLFIGKVVLMLLDHLNPLMSPQNLTLVTSRDQQLKETPEISNI